MKFFNTIDGKLAIFHSYDNQNLAISIQVPDEDNIRYIHLDKLTYKTNNVLVEIN